MDTRQECDYELIPMSPIRRLEQRMERLESSPAFDQKEIFKDVMEIIKMNQMLVDEVIKANDSLRMELSRLPGKIEELIVNIKEIVDFIKSSGEEQSSEVTKEAMKPVVDKLDEMVKINRTMTEKSDSMLELLDEIGNKLKRPSTTTMPLRPLMPQVRPSPMGQPLRTIRPI
jgi:methyl-accepting chemotaxis protein